MNKAQANEKTKKENTTKSDSEHLHFYSQLKKIPGSLFELNHLPPLGEQPDFPFEELSRKLGEIFGVPSLLFEPQAWAIRAKDGLKEGLGGELVCLQFALSPLEGPLYFFMSKQDLLTISAKIFLKNGEPSVALESYLDACIAFFSAEVIYALESLSFNENLHPQLLETRDFPAEDMITIDIIIRLSSYKAIGRLLFSKKLQSALRAASLQKQNGTAFSSRLAEQTEVILHLEAGSVQLSQQEWKNVKAGDFLILDQSNFKPDQSEGEITLSLKGHPFCKAKIEAGKVKILDITR